MCQDGAMASAAVAAAPTADAEGRPAQPDPGGLRLAEALTPLMNEPTAPNRPWLVILSVWCYIHQILDDITTCYQLRWKLLPLH